MGPADDNGMVEVQVGVLRLNVALAELESSEEPVQKDYADYFVMPRPVPSEIHLRGLRVEEARWELEQYLEQALDAGLKEVRVVHGKGTGAVRLMAHEMLRKHPKVETLRAALPSEGGEGATIAILKV
jgi:DNA mismatch repair protein MutS2